MTASALSGSKTTMVANRVLHAAALIGADCSLLSLDELDVAVPDGRRAEDYTGDTRLLLERLDAADGVVLAMPVYRATMPGKVKNLLDLIPRGRWDGATAPLRAKPVVVVATGATTHHFLAIDEVSGILRGFFAAYVVPPGIYACHSDFVDGELASPTVEALADRSGSAVVALSNAIRGSDHLRAVEPQI